MGFYEDVAALLDGDDNEKAKTAANMQFYSFYYAEEPYNKSLKTPQLQSDRVDESGNKKDIDALEADDLQAAKEGRLFVVSDKKPFLRQVTVGENGSVRLDPVNRNPIKIPEGASEEEQKSWGNLKNKFDDLIIGNADSSFWARGRRRRKAQKAAKEIAKLAKEAEKHQFDELKTEDEDVLEEVKKEEAKQEEKTVEKTEELEAEKKEEKKEEKTEVKEGEEKKEEKTEVKQGEEKKEEKTEAEKKEEKTEVKQEEQKAENAEVSASEKADSLIKQGKHTEAAAYVAKEIKQKSDIFNDSKLIEGDALEAGKEIRKLLNLAKSDKKLMDELEKLPEFKGNKNMYQGQANLSEMAQKGKEAYEKLIAQPENPNDKANEMSKQEKEKLILDVMTGEAANAMKNYNVMKSMLEIVETQPESNKVIESMHKMLKKSGEIKELSEATTKELDKSLSNSFQKQKAFIGAFNEAKEVLKNEEKNSELQAKKELQKENANGKNNGANNDNQPVLKNKEGKTINNASNMEITI